MLAQSQNQGILNICDQPDPTVGWHPITPQHQQEIIFDQKEWVTY